MQNKHDEEDCATAAAAAAAATNAAGNVHPSHRKGGRKRRLRSGRRLYEVDVIMCLQQRDIPINMTKMPAGKDQSAAAATKVEVEAASYRGGGMVQRQRC